MAAPRDVANNTELDFLARVVLGIGHLVDAALVVRPESCRHGEHIYLCAKLFEVFFVCDPKPLFFINDQ